MIIRGRVHRFGDSISTDQIIAGKYKNRMSDWKELSTHLFEELVPDFYRKVKEGDLIVAGKNFGCGSSREAAPRVIQKSGVRAILAKSFARIFYRNGFNIGLPLIECDTSSISDGSELLVDLGKGQVENITDGAEISFKPIPAFMLQILLDGGLVSHFKKFRRFNL
jgi:3-isopropylmalate/(R)-2-methylmalate dehydratase small subunit